MKHSLTYLSQQLRKNPTKEEARLWYQFLRKYPLQFRRQVQFGSYIVDFYCAKAKIVEPKKQDYDKKRTCFLEEQGLKVLRYTNSDIALRFRQVCEAIDQEVRKQYSEDF